jgi:hypothetical protein
VNVMAIEDSPIYEAIITELGNPVPVVAMDCSYEAMLALAAVAPAQPASPVNLHTAPKRLVSKAGAPLLAASAARDAG